MGFILTPEEAQALIDKDPKNKDILFPYLNGEDLNSRPDQSPSRWVINFKDWPIEKAQEYTACFSIVTDRVKPYRDELINKGKQIHEYDYWKFWDKRLESYAAIAGMQRVLVIAAVSRTVAFSFVLKNQVYAHKLIVFAINSNFDFSILQSNFHYSWVWQFSSTMKLDLNYRVYESKS